jgi:hypothetical protein
VPDTRHRTSGGRFCPQDEYRYFLVDGGSGRRQVQSHGSVLVPMNALGSTASLDRLDRLCDEADVMIDSGVFNLAMTYARSHGCTMTQALAVPPDELDGFPRLWDTYAEVASRFIDRLWGMVELDQGGADEKRKTRARIETEMGIVPIPVLHPLLDPIGYFEELTDRASGYDRICCGNIAMDGMDSHVLLWLDKKMRDVEGVWVHLLGMSPTAILTAYPVGQSSDSSTVYQNYRWGRPLQAWAGLTPFETLPDGFRYGGADSEHEGDGWEGALLDAAARQDALREMRRSVWGNVTTRREAEAA